MPNDVRLSCTTFRELLKDSTWVVDMFCLKSSAFLKIIWSSITLVSRLTELPPCSTGWWGPQSACRLQRLWGLPCSVACSLWVLLLAYEGPAHNLSGSGRHELVLHVDKFMMPFHSLIFFGPVDIALRAFSCCFRACLLMVTTFSVRSW